VTRATIPALKRTAEQQQSKLLQAKSLQLKGHDLKLEDLRRKNLVLERQQAELKAEVKALQRNEKAHSKDLKVFNDPSVFPEKLLQMQSERDFQQKLLKDTQLKVETQR